MNTIIYLAGHFLIIFLISIILIAILICFAGKFVLPAIGLQKILKTAIVRLQEKKTASKGMVSDLEEISREVMTSSPLRHPWKEYSETLHEQKDESGREKSLRFRSTTLAETFFTEQVLVDTPLKTEFYKHLPGILTGLGIIGTFSGLIVGLVRFEVSGDADRVRASLNGLIQSVGYSFVVSASAITLSMLFIWLEKSLVTKCYRLVEQLCQTIDSMFDAGAGEEYLARLVAATEMSATHTARMRETLAADLKRVLSEITKQQVQESALLHKQLTENIAHTLAATVREPFERISQAVESVGANQGTAVNTLVTEALAGFADRMNNLIGDRLQGINDLMQQTAANMQSAAMQINRFAENMQATEKGAATTMIERLNTAMATLEARQQSMDAHMVEFIEKIGAAANSSQSQASRKIESFVGELGEKVTEIISRIETQSNQAGKEYGARQVQLTKYTNSAFAEISSQIQTLSAEMRQASEAMRSSVSALSQTTKESVMLFSSGANTLNAALNGFATAGQGVSNTMVLASKATEKIGIASSNLVQATNGVQGMLEDYQNMSRTFAVTVSELKSVIENARRDASMSSGIVMRMQKAAEQLSIAEDKANDYLHGVTEVLAQAHAEFAGNIELTLRKSNSQFHEELSKSVSLISGAIQDFGDVLDSVVEKGEVRCSA